MILIADSGSTKTEWILLDKKNNHSHHITTDGINPYYQSITDIKTLLNNQFSAKQNNFNEIYFYGAGCNTSDKKSIIKKALLHKFNTEQIYIDSDLMAACRASCIHTPGIVSILGTGSNSCFYNGKIIEEQVSPLGYILGDEGSGATLGKILISDILKNQLSESTAELFYNTYNNSAAEILENVYKKPFPNRYLAQYTKFISQHIEIPEIELIVINAFKSFIKRNLFQYEELKKHELHFIGSIAFYFKEQLKKALQEFNLQIGTISKSPSKGLIKFHSL